MRRRIAHEPERGDNGQHGHHLDDHPGDRLRRLRGVAHRNRWALPVVDEHYSQYSQGGYDGRSKTFLRGIQTTDSAGRVAFTTVYPGWYQGRATHIHVEVSINGRSVKVTQIAFPESVNAQVYRSGVYASRGLNPTSNTSDMVFSDSLSSELASVTGDPSSGFAATFTVGISV